MALPYLTLRLSQFVQHSLEVLVGQHEFPLVGVERQVLGTNHLQQPVASDPGLQRRAFGKGATAEVADRLGELYLQVASWARLT